ncbi:MAG: DUF2089 domain-containing protein [Anaerolineae bacterium]|nr:DUF2089 domain-containing protein [Anaerolineae bacterium]
MATRKEVLEMLARGEISTDEAAALLSGAATASNGDPPASPKPVLKAPLKGKSGRRWLHIQVSDLASGKARVRVNVPLGLVHFGLKVGARFTDEVDAEMMHDILEALQDGDLTGTLVEVEDLDDNERVHIYVD